MEQGCADVTHPDAASCHCFIDKKCDRFAILANGFLAAFFVVMGSFNGLVTLIGESIGHGKHSLRCLSLELAHPNIKRKTWTDNNDHYQSKWP